MIGKCNTQKSQLGIFSSDEFELVSSPKVNSINVYKISKGDICYEIYKYHKLGEGSYSSVCLGKMVTKTNFDGKFVAVKKIVKSMLTSHGLSMLTSEIKIIKEMISHDHNNIIKCYDVIDDIDVIYIIMEYCEDGDLSNLLVGKPLKYKYIKYYFGQIVKALKYLNDKNIIHRDIKPKNILVTNNKHTIKLCDFGFARHTNGLKKVMTMCGSPLYMAPEIYQKIGYSDLVDVWSLGMILYEMLFGSHPLKNFNDPQKIADSITNLDIPIPKNNNKITEIEPECLNLLSQMLQRKEINRISIQNLFENKWIIECMEIIINEDIDRDTIIQNMNVSKLYENFHNTVDDTSIESKTSDIDNNSTIQEKELSFVFDMDE